MAAPTPPTQKSLRDRVDQLLLVVRTIPPTVKLLWEAAPGGLLWLFVLTLLQALVPAAIAWVAKLIIDGVVAAQQNPTSSSHNEVMQAVAIELGLVVLQTLLQRTQWLVREITAARLKRSLGVRVLEKALALELHHFEDSSLYDKMQNARREADTRPLNLVLEALSSLQNGITLLTYGVLIFSLAPWALLVLVLAALPSFLSELRFAGESFRVMTWRAPEGRRLNYLEWVLTRDGTVKEVKSLGLGALFLGRFTALFDRLVAEDLKLAKRRVWWGALFGIVAACAFYACYAFVANDAAHGTMTLGQLTFALAAFRQGQQAFQSILSSVGSMARDALFMSNFFVFLAVEANGERARATPALTLPKGPGLHRIELRNVSFAYPSKDQDQNKGKDKDKDKDKVVLRDVSLTIEPGQKIALVGENGVGKSTLVKLLLRLYAPTSGDIFYGGINLKDMDPADVRSRMAAVFQDFVKYQMIVRENVGVGDVTHLDDEARVGTAVEQAGATSVVERAGGLQAMLGGWFEDGQELSGGQWQKLALARGFMRADAEVLILDEPTAAVDARAEAELFANIKTLAAHKTAFLISHRFSTVRMADRILVLAGGTIIEDGSHDELVARGGKYAELFALQAKGYQ
jgi:ATP-binding cassette, subfamily B, bacterial